MTARTILGWTIPLSFLALVVTFFCLGYKHVTRQETNYCIIDNPTVVVFGEIYPARSGVFTTTPQTHYLWYKGKWKLTEGACKTRRCVTEREYEKRIYGY